MPLLQTAHIFAHRIFTQLGGLANRFVAGPALVCFAILTAEQVGVDRDLAGVQTEGKQLIGEREIIFVGIAFGPVSVHHFSPPVCCSTYWRNFSLGTTKRLPMRRDGKPSSCMSSYALEMAMPSVLATSVTFRNIGSWS